MKIVCNGKVYDLDWNASWKICDLPASYVDEVGHQHEVTRELRRAKVTADSKRTGDLFVLEKVDGDYFYRNKVNVTPLTPDEAAMIAEKHVDYDAYVEFFGDPRGTGAENEEKVKAAETRQKAAESGRDYWRDQCSKVTKDRDELKAKLDELKAKLDELKGGE